MGWSFARRRVRLIPVALALTGVCITAYVLAVYSINSSGLRLRQSVMQSWHAVNASNHKIADGVLARKPVSTSERDGGDVTTTAYKRKFIRKMMSHAWNSYVQHAFGHSELAPVSRRAHLTGVFGGSPSLGATIVDALDTLWIMGLRDEFHRGRQWVAQHFKLADADYNLSLFEINIRLLGGLLSAFSLAGDQVRAHEYVRLDRIMGPYSSDVFGESIRIWSDGVACIQYAKWFAVGSIQLQSKTLRKNHGGSVTFLADVGTLHLEFAYLSAVTGDDVFLAHANHIRDVLDKQDKKPSGFYRDHIDVITGKWSHQRHTNVGSLGDSFYEYLFKSWLLSNRTDATAKRMYDEAMQAIEKELVTATPKEEGGKRQLVYFWQINDYGARMAQMDYTACFMGALYALSAPYADDPSHYLLRAVQVADTCHFASISTKTGFAPELFGIYATNPVSVRPLVSSYLMRPEIVETYFVLWRATRNPLYRKWGWASAQAIEKHCRTDSGYSGLRDINRVNPSSFDDVQPSYFLAETLKYLYLLFVDEKPSTNGDGLGGRRRTTAEDDGGMDISLDEYVFTTEGHPLPIFGKSRVPHVAELTDVEKRELAAANST